MACYFYPRSPCGERHSDPVTDKAWALISIHALLAESDPPTEQTPPPFWISIHALLAESDVVSCGWCGVGMLFLSTLSLRRATVVIKNSTAFSVFLSTLSLRRATAGFAGKYLTGAISIHALLAESDFRVTVFEHAIVISIHALLAESDRYGVRIAEIDLAFLSTLSLRRATPRSENRR